MSDTPDNTPSVDENAIREKLQAELEAKYRTQFEEEKQKIIGNRDQILEEKRQLEQRFKGVDPDKLEQFEQYRKRVEADEELQLIEQGKIDDVIRRRMEGREKAWNETQAEYEERLKAAQTQATEFEKRAAELENKAREMMKRQYFKDLTAEDDSFKKDYFGDFFALQSKFADVDESTGIVYALDENGKRRVDTDGNLVKFEDYYAKLKVNHGLFWNGGQGSGIKGGGANGEVFGTNPEKWTTEQKLQYIEQHGHAAYAEALAKSKRK